MAKEITLKMVDDGAAAYYRATGSGPSRAGIRAAMFYGPTVPELSDEERDLLVRLVSKLDVARGDQTILYGDESLANLQVALLKRLLRQL
jgi:hypothetical protein